MNPIDWSRYEKNLKDVEYETVVLFDAGKCQHVFWKENRCMTCGKKRG